jgi:hypothetical protein
MTTADRRTAIPARGWEQEVPLYKATRDVRPSPNDRHRFEPPFAQMSDNSCWQFADRPVKSGELIETKSWPHPSFHPMNRSAERVMAFFNSAPKSRLGLSPYAAAGHLQLDDGLPGPTQPKFKIGATAA